MLGHRSSRPISCALQLFSPPRVSTWSGVHEVLPLPQSPLEDAFGGAQVLEMLLFLPLEENAVKPTKGVEDTQLHPKPQTHLCAFPGSLACGLLLNLSPAENILRMRIPSPSS